MKRVSVTVGRGEKRLVIARVQPNERYEISERTFSDALAKISVSDYLKIRVIAPRNLKVININGECVCEIIKTRPQKKTVEWPF